MWRSGVRWRGRRCMSGCAGMPTVVASAAWRTARRGRRPARIRCPPEVKDRIAGLRRAHPAWGPSRIRWQLEQQGVEPLPGPSSAYRALVRHGRIVPGKRKRRREDYRRWERGRSMELWQMDAMGRMHLADGREGRLSHGDLLPLMPPPPPPSRARGPAPRPAHRPHLR